jgi:hypothetical protein
MTYVTDLWYLEIGKEGEHHRKERITVEGKRRLANRLNFSKGSMAKGCRLVSQVGI